MYLNQKVWCITLTFEDYLGHIMAAAAAATVVNKVNCGCPVRHELWLVHQHWPVTSHHTAPQEKWSSVISQHLGGLLTIAPFLEMSVSSNFVLNKSMVALAVWLYGRLHRAVQTIPHQDQCSPCSQRKSDRSVLIKQRQLMPWYAGQCWVCYSWYSSRNAGKRPIIGHPQFSLLRTVVVAVAICPR